ncbi:GntR family transcriptional regulator [Xanthobacter tagetidis]|uniref:GntR family transcriptional regulator n=1 Tax=Xanthobacter tagetidis TaxID=60216 RepID=A0A3L7AML8_9HYPH|nr:GntR family transcriptional regulator [Xanthobacter tagetidis]
MILYDLPMTAGGSRVSADAAGLSKAPKKQARQAAVLDALRKDILDGLIPPGAPLRQDDLAAAHHVSKIPVREALLHLVAEGLVHLEPNRGFTVAALGAQDAEELLDMRAVLECHMLRLAIPHMSDADIGIATRIVEEAEAVEELGRWSQLNFAFHAAISAPAKRHRLAGLIRQVSNPTDAYVRVLLTNANYRGQAEREHRAILSACAVRNAEAATALLDQHIRQTGVLLADVFAGKTASSAAPHDRPLAAADGPKSPRRR